MYSVHEVSKISGISIRALHHYDDIGLLPPTSVNEAGYRFYDDEALDRLKLILMFRELEFPLKDIKTILDSPAFEKERALRQQLQLFSLKKDRLDKLILLAESMINKGEPIMGFEAFSSEKIDSYAKQAKETWGDTAAYKEFENKNSGRTNEQNNSLGKEMMNIFCRFGEIKGSETANSSKAVSLARELQSFISEHYYNCTDTILLSLANMYAAGGEFTENIDAVGGAGTAEYVKDVIHAALGK